MFGFIERQKASHHIATMARVLGVSRTGLYARRVRPRSLRALADEVLVDVVERIHQGSRGTYGAPRVHAELRLVYDIHCSRKRVARLMRQKGLLGVSRRRIVRTTVRDESAAPAPDLVGRDFHANRPKKVCVADITYVATGEGFLYVAAVVDACTRRCVGWSMRSTLHAEIVSAALDMATARTHPSAGLIHHSDQGGSTRASSSAVAAASPGSCRRWDRSATRTTVRLVLPLGRPDSCLRLTAGVLAVDLSAAPSGVHGEALAERAVTA